MSTADRSGTNLIKQMKNAVLSGYKTKVENAGNTRVAGHRQNPTGSTSYIINTGKGKGLCCNGYPNSCGQTTGTYNQCNNGSC